MAHSIGRRRLRGGPALAVVLAAAAVAGIALSACGPSPSKAAKPKANPDVLLVGTYQGDKGGFSTIQGAVNHAKPGDWILIAPGDYHEDDDHLHPPTAAEAGVGDMGGVLITTPNIHLRGMNRSTVIVDGTKAGAPKPCDSSAAWQDYGATGADGKAYGRDGILIWKADNVSVDNLTICNFLSGTGASGNEVWWNGGDGSAKIGLKGYWGYYLTATDSFYQNETTAPAYGIFSSNSAGPGNWNYLYANNFNDSGMYVGACQQACDMTIDHAWMENDALGYSGTNSGGQIIIENSQFDDNEDGLDTNTQINGDPPAPQNGDCPTTTPSNITQTHSCWVFVDNYVHNNNNDSTPKAGSAAAGPTGTGMTISGGTNDTVMNNKFENNGAWGILFVPYPDMSPPQDHQTCSGTGGVEEAIFGCVYDPKDDALIDNTFVHDGYFGNPSNSDFGQITLFGGQPGNCYSGNVAPQGSSPADLEKAQPKCGVTTQTSNTGGPLFNQVLCDTGFGACPAGAKYPMSKKVVLTSVPKNLPTMPNPCSGVPTNPWCPGKGSGYSMPARSPQAPVRTRGTTSAAWRRVAV
ncbi:MAG: hypothetical protein ACRD0Z_07245 [Acidimicrobiales bacterium]